MDLNKVSPINKGMCKKHVIIITNWHYAQVFILMIMTNHILVYQTIMITNQISNLMIQNYTTRQHQSQTQVTFS